jgi:zinc/manganese transport system substrate-binding protein
MFTEADLVIANGLDLEEGLLDVLEGAVADGANVVRLGPALSPLDFGHEPGSLDPHVWLDPVRMAEAARLIAAELDALDDSVDWGARAESYAAALAEVDDRITEILSVVPPGERTLVTNHDALGYFAARYGFEVVGTVIPGGATLAEPSSAELADLVAEIALRGVPAIFVETTGSATLAEAVAREVGDEIAVIELFTGSLGGPGSGADTLVGMLLTNATLIAEALS